MLLSLNKTIPPSQIHKRQYNFREAHFLYARDVVLKHQRRVESFLDRLHDTQTNATIQWLTCTATESEMLIIVPKT